MRSCSSRDVKIASVLPIIGWPGYPFKGISIFDCPEHNHTSPISTSSNTMVFSSVNWIRYGPPATGVCTKTRQTPALLARSEERRVGKEGKSGGVRWHKKGDGILVR